MNDWRNTVEAIPPRADWDEEGAEESVTAPDGAEEAVAVAPTGGGPPDLDSMSLYLAEIAARHRLTAAEERDCCRALREAMAAGAGRNPPPPEAQETIEACRRRLLDGHLHQVVAIARGYGGLSRHLNLTVDDLVQEGNFGLMTAVRRFEPKRGVRFAAYAAPWIQYTICRAISEQARLIRIPLEVLALRRRAARVASELEQECRNETCRDGKPHEHRLVDDARVLGVRPQVLEATLLSVPHVVSLDEPETLEDGEPRSESVADARASNPGEAAAEAERRERVRERLSELPERSAYILRRRYGVGGGPEAGLAELGRELGISAERVRQVQERAVEILRRNPHLLQAAAHACREAAAGSRSANRRASDAPPAAERSAAAPGPGARTGRARSSLARPRETAGGRRVTASRVAPGREPHGAAPPLEKVDASP